MKYLSVILILVLCGCGSSNRTVTDADIMAYNSLKDLVDSKSFFIEHYRAIPMGTQAMMQLGNANVFGPGNTANSINILGQSNSLEIKKDSAIAYLPFFGEQRMPTSNYGNHQGITFNGLVNEYNVVFDDEKMNATIRFEIDDHERSQERYQVWITIFKNKNCRTQIQSARRTNMEYLGNVRRIDTEDTSL